MSPSCRPRPGGRVRLLVLSLLLAAAAALAAPAAWAAPAGRTATADRLIRALGSQQAGAYLDASGRLTVNVLGAAAAAEVRAAGPTPRPVTRSLASLERVKASLDAAAGAPVGASWARTCPPRRVALLGRVHTRSGSGRYYVLTAGHCANLGGTWTTSSGQTIGSVAASSFPGNDFGAS
jgi:streptogrisin D